MRRVSESVGNSPGEWTLVAQATVAQSAQVQESSPLLGIGRKEVVGRDPRLALGLAILVGLLVFALLWKIRKTFGMRE